MSWQCLCCPHWLTIYSSCFIGMWVSGNQTHDWQDHTAVAWVPIPGNAWALLCANLPFLVKNDWPFKNFFYATKSLFMLSKNDWVEIMLKNWGAWAQINEAYHQSKILSESKWLEHMETCFWHAKNKKIKICFKNSDLFSHSFEEKSCNCESKSCNFLYFFIFFINYNINYLLYKLWDINSAGLLVFNAHLQDINRIMRKKVYLLQLWLSLQYVFYFFYFILFIFYSAMNKKVRKR